MTKQKDHRVKPTSMRLSTAHLAVLHQRYLAYNARQVATKMSKSDFYRLALEIGSQVLEKDIEIKELEHSEKPVELGQ